MNHIAAIWTSPRATIREILDTNPRSMFLPFAATYGIVHSLHLVVRHEIDHTTGATVLEVLLINIVAGGLCGIGIIFLFSHLIAVAGRLLRGRPSAQAARTVLAWASVPYLPLLAVLIPLIFVAGNALIFHSQHDVFRGAAGTTPQLASLVYLFGRLVMIVWSIAIAVIGLSEAFGISTGRSFIVLLLAAIVAVALILGAFSLLATIGVL